METNSTQHLFEENQGILTYLKKSRIFGHFPEEVLQKLIPLSEIVQFPKGASILQEGEQNASVYFLLRGEVSVYAGDEYILSMRRIGDIFGEMSIISDKPCSASVIADTPVNLFSIRAKNIGEYAQVDAKDFQDTLYRVFATILTEKLSMTTHRATLMDNILQSMASPMIIIDSDAIIQTFNAATHNLLGYQEEELSGKPIETIIVEEQEKIFQESGIEMLIKKGSIQEGEGVFSAKDGKKIPVLFSCSIMYEKEDKIQGIVCVIQDNTKHKQREEKLVKQKMALETLLEKQDKLSENLIQTATQFKEHSQKLRSVLST